MSRGRAKKDIGRIGVLMGGSSSEREISLKSGRAVLMALTDSGFDATGLDADRNLPANLVSEGIERAFIALHGPLGEDGAVQGLLEIMGIPYTGSGVLSSALCMDKEVSKALMRSCGVRTPEYTVLSAPDEKVSIPASMRLPYVVKPACEGSTIGIRVVEKRGELKGAVEEAFKYSDKVLIESFVEGREITVSVLDGAALPVVEIKPKDGFYDYDSKYTPGKVDFEAPAGIGATLTKKAEAIAVKIYKRFGCRGAARVDIIIDKNGVMEVLEINTVPGMTETSLLPMAARAAGLDYKKLVTVMIEGAALDGFPQALRNSDGEDR